MEPTASSYDRVAEKYAAEFENELERKPFEPENVGLVGGVDRDKSLGICTAVASKRAASISPRRW